MNREQRRAYDRKIKKQPNASICPECNHLAMFYTEADTSTNPSTATILKCERCGAIVREGEELTKILPSGLYLPTSLSILDKALLMEASRIEEDNNESDTNSPVEIEGTVT